VLERARPLAAAWRHGAALRDVLRSWPHVQEAAACAAQLLRARVPYGVGWNVAAIEAAATGLRVACQHGSGELRHHWVQHLALHDGLLPNSTGLPPAMRSETACIVHAGDCREVLGAVAAADDGRRAARQVARHCDPAGTLPDDRQLDQAIALARRTQGALAQLFQTPALVPTANTVICRCEGLRRADLARLQVAGSARELRLVGRFGMGACQGRFCAHSVSALAHEYGIDFAPEALSGEVQRWPLRPVSLVALANYTEQETSF